jgi:hypothetical protein
MPDPDFTLRRGDTTSALQATLENSGGTPVTIKGATVVLKLASVAGGTLSVAAAATVDQVGAGTAVGGSMGQVHYNWAAADVATAGWYAGEWEVTFSSGTIQTFPNTDPFLVQITKDVSDL